MSVMKESSAGSMSPTREEGIGSLEHVAFEEFFTTFSTSSLAAGSKEDYVEAEGVSQASRSNDRSSRPVAINSRFSRMLAILLMKNSLND